MSARSSMRSRRMVQRPEPRLRASHEKLPGPVLLEFVAKRARVALFLSSRIPPNRKPVESLEINELRWADGIVASVSVTVAGFVIVVIPGLVCALLRRKLPVLLETRT